RPDSTSQRADSTVQGADAAAEDAGSASSRAGEQEALEDRTERLGRSLAIVQQMLLDMGEESSSTQTGSAREKARAGQQSMGKAAEQARRQEGSEAARSAGRAARRMAEASGALAGARQELAREQEQQTSEAVRQSTEEALELAQRQETLRQAMAAAQRGGGVAGEQLRALRSEQGAVREGLGRLRRNLSEAGQRSAPLDPGVGRALERAQLKVDETLEGLGDGRGMPLRSAEASVESLNQLALSLLEEAIPGSPGSGAAAEELLRRLSRVAQEQGALNGRLGALPLRQQPRGFARQLREAAEQQRGIARRIGELSGMSGGREDVLGRLDQLSSEATVIARDLDGGRLDPDVMARQQRLFHRLLDAGRSLEHDEYSDERAGRRAGSVDVPSPEALDPELAGGVLRYPPPTPTELERLPPAYRRLILQYFDRLNGLVDADQGRQVRASDGERGESRGGPP
ncbi:MAG: hypothetical protein ACOCUW_05130, partial [Gemmatimonadota bacterium]